MPKKLVPFALVTITILGLSLLAACSSGGGSTTTTKTTTPPPTTTKTTTPPPTTTTTTAPPTTTTVAAAPALPANHKTPPRTSCLVCHKDGIGGAPKVPASHASYNDANNAALCLGCHK